LTNHRTIDDYNDMPTEHVISLEYLTYFIVLYCVLAAFCQLLLNEYCIVLYCILIFLPQFHILYTQWRISD